MGYPLSQLQHEHASTVIDDASGYEVFHAPSPHSLIQAAGYLKHTRAINAGKGVFFRGQTKLHPGLSTSLLRGIGDKAQIERRKAMQEFLDDLEAKGNALRAVEIQCREALLQHYGIRTTWLDVVDNIWVALWFACHRALTWGQGAEEFLHFEKRIPTRNSDEESEYAYVLLIEAAFFGPAGCRPGYYRDASSETIDLRVAAPSQFIRPHAQHGILVRKLSKKGLPVGDCSTLHVGTIRVELEAALDWLGSAATLTGHSLFPPAYYDYGYRELLEFVRPQSEYLGRIYHVQA